MIVQRAQAFVTIEFIIALFVLGFLLPFGTSPMLENVLMTLIALCEGIVLGTLVSSTRGILRLRERFLDERQLTLRYRIFYGAYKWLSLIIFVLASAIFLVMNIETNSFARPFTITFSISFIRAFSLMIGTLMTIVSLPYILFAFTASGEEVMVPSDEN
jgi:hypothetical protein